MWQKSKPKFEGKMKLHKGDEIVVLVGKDKGKKGKIIGTNPDNGTVFVDGVNMVTRHQKPRGQSGRTPSAQLGEIQKPAAMAISKVMLVCPKCGKQTRTLASEVADRSSGRKCKKCGELVD